MASEDLDSLSVRLNGQKGIMRVRVVSHLRRCYLHLSRLLTAVDSKGSHGLLGLLHGTFCDQQKLC